LRSLALAALRYNATGSKADPRAPALPARQYPQTTPED
jgi:hypothetical protein